mmetsp:Transcript_6153/g.15259  ORF Transcript_6153/g.15259 Transcript_6153/m.15259 type:complete len:218 (-) Transcript_6153:187-840(-)
MAAPLVASCMAGVRALHSSLIWTSAVTRRWTTIPFAGRPAAARRFAATTTRLASRAMTRGLRPMWMQPPFSYSRSCIRELSFLSCAARSASSATRTKRGPRCSRTRALGSAWSNQAAIGSIVAAPVRSTTGRVAPPTVASLAGFLVGLPSVAGIRPRTRWKTGKVSSRPSRSTIFAALPLLWELRFRGLSCNRRQCRPLSAEKATTIEKVVFPVAWV